MDKQCLPFALLADEDKAVCQAYGVRKVIGVARTTFVIDKAGKVAKVFEKVKAAGHSREVLEWVEEK